MYSSQLVGPGITSLLAASRYPFAAVFWRSVCAPAIICSKKAKSHWLSFFSASTSQRLDIWHICAVHFDLMPRNHPDLSMAIRLRTVRQQLLMECPIYWMPKSRHYSLAWVLYVPNDRKPFADIDSMGRCQHPHWCNPRDNSPTVRQTVVLLLLMCKLGDSWRMLLSPLWLLLMGKKCY